MKAVAWNVALLAVTFCVTEAGAVTFHVSPFGSNTPPYSSFATAAQDPRDANSLATGYGDTVLLHAGEYLIPSTIVVALGVTWIGDGADSVTLHWTGGTQPPIWIVGGVGDNLFSGICFLNPNPQGQNALTGLGKGTNGELSLTVAHCRFNACQLSLSVLKSADIHDNQFDVWVGDGIHILGSGEFHIHDNLFLGGTYAQGRAIILDNGARAVIERNVLDFRASLGNGLQQGQLIMVLSYVMAAAIRNNLILGGNWPIFWSQASGSIENNTIAWGSDQLFFWLDLSDTLIVRNNILYNLAKPAFPHDPCPACFVFVYNAFWPPEDSIYNPYPGQIDPADTGNFSAYPMFADDNLFHLQYGSPLTDAGDPSILDADGSRSDIGWTGGPVGITYEYLDLPPIPPETVIADGETTHVVVQWSHGYGTDLQGYRIYRGQLPGFWHLGLVATAILPPADTIRSENLSLADDSVFYVITTFDEAGHESTPSVEARYLVAEHPTNRPPSFEGVPEQSVDVGDTLIVPILASDPDGNTIALAVVNLLPVNATFVDSGGGHGVFTFAPDVNQVGEHSVEFTANDGISADTLDLAIHVHDTTQLTASPGIVKVYPNPLNGEGSAEVSVPGPLGRARVVKLVLHDLLGRTIATCFEGSLGGGDQLIPLNLTTSGIGVDLATGVYLLRLQVDGKTLGKLSKIAVVR